MKQTLNEQIGRIKSIMNINEDESQMALMQSTQEFNEKAEEDLTPDEFQEVVCTHPDAIELPSETTNEQKQKFEEFKAKVKTASIAELKAAKRQLKELKRQEKQQNEQYTGTLVTLLGIQMPLAFAYFTYGFLLLLILNGLLSLFGIHLIKSITDWCTGKRTVGYGIRFGRRD